MTTDYTYSKVDLSGVIDCKDAKKALLIGLNPRAVIKNDTKTIKHEYDNYCKYKQKNPNAKHRESVKDALEPTRSNVIKDLLRINILINSLVTVDLFSKRTYTSKDLIDSIKKDNLEKIKCEIEKADIVVIAWGNVDMSLWNSNEIQQYRNEVLELLKTKSCYWYGENKNGSPKHPASYGARQLTEITETELLEKAFGR